MALIKYSLYYVHGGLLLRDGRTSSPPSYYICSACKPYNLYEGQCWHIQTNLQFNQRFASPEINVPLFTFTSSTKIPMHDKELQDELIETSKIFMTFLHRVGKNITKKDLIHFRFSIDEIFETFVRNNFEDVHKLYEECDLKTFFNHNHRKLILINKKRNL